MSGKYSSVLWLSEIAKDDVAEVGQKAARLGEMTRAGYPVPAGFVITNHALQHFLHENNLPTRINALLTTVHYEDISSIMQISNHIKRLIMQAHLSPDLVKEIDGAYRKFGGFFHHAHVVVSLSKPQNEKESAFLDVQGESNVLLKIRESWAALFAPPELRRHHVAKRDHFQTSAAVLVQKMLEPEVSGTILTHDPINHDRNTALIEAVYGFSHHSLQYDHYEVNKHDLIIKKKKFARQERMLQRHGHGVTYVAVPKKLQAVQKLSDNKILDIVVMAKKLEKQYYFPQMISWAIEKNKLYFLRARQLDPAPHPEKAHEYAPPSKYLPLLLKATPAAPGLKKGPVKIIRHAKELVYIHPGDVLVTAHTSAEYVPYIKKAAAVITEQGGHVSTAAHVSREFGIPAIIGANQATKVLHAGAIVTVNGTTGEVFGGAVHSQPHNGISTATKLYVNITDTTHVNDIAKEHVDGIGYFHSDLLLREIGIHPQKLVSEHYEHIYTDKLKKQLTEVCKAFAPRPVVFSFNDLLTTQMRQLEGGKLYEPTETNPLIGFRGAYRLIHTPKLFSLEMQAIREIRLTNTTNIWLMMPFVRTQRELEEIKRQLTAHGLHRTPTLKLWMNVSTPANLISLDTYVASGLDGIAIDLDAVVSLLLGVDKNNSSVVKEFNPYDPAVLWILQQALKICNKHHVPLSVNGKTASQFPNLIEKLVHWGVSSISVEPNEIHNVRVKIQEAEKNRLLNYAKK